MLLPDDHAATRWSRALLAALVPASAGYRAPTAVGGYRVDVIDLDMVNAFALPGGQLYLTTGLLLNARDCDEVAGVLAHEIGHVVERHAVEDREAQKAGSWLGKLLFGDDDTALVSDAAFGLLRHTSFSRRDEAEADRVGVRIAGGAGFDPRGVVRFFERGDGGPAGFFDSHPANAERVADVTSVIADTWPTAVPAGVGCPGGSLAQLQAELRRREEARKR